MPAVAPFLEPSPRGGVIPYMTMLVGLSLFVAACFSLLWPDPAAAWPEKSSLSSDTNGKFVSSASAGDGALDFYTEKVDPGIQRDCLICHKADGPASSSGARLTLTTAPAANHEGFLDFVGHDDVDAAWIMAKTAGSQGHGGGAVLSPGSELYLALEHYLSLLEGESSDPIAGYDFWQGTTAEPRETTLRRAALLFVGELASDEAVKNAKESEEGLRAEILDALTGEGFKEFILRGANDRLLVEGLLNGINFDISTYDRYPELADWLLSLPEYRPEEFEDNHDRPFLTRQDADWNFRWAITREPLELVAHVIMNDRPYTEVLTADHTMVNAFSSIAYRSEAGFGRDLSDENGFYDRSLHNRFTPGYNDGHIPHDRHFEASQEEGITSFSEYHEWPHAGILSTQAWLARYPSTDTNRNRARARWTYFHFLGVDIEKSAPRTMDPAALTDTDNPTLNNSNCTVCHQRLDPLAGSYQSFGDSGHYLDQWGGLDSLADSYKCPECYGGKWGSTPYEEGDTWYRDMRAPGFEGQEATVIERDSLQWLAERIAADPRFPAATVRFWWPAIFGAPPLSLPEDAAGPDHEAKIRAYQAQEALIAALAIEFEESGFNARELFVGMVMSPWYRNSEVDDPDLVDSRQIELATVGRGRLLGPEELDRKNLATLGRTWRQWGSGKNPHSFVRETALSGQWAEFRGFYGGIDGAAVTERNSEMTSLMSNLTESMAADLACQVVIEDFNRPRNERVLFQQLDRTSVPGQLTDVTEQLQGTVTDMDKLQEHSVRSRITTVRGPSRVRIHDMTRNSYESKDGDWTGSELIVKEVLFKQGNRTVRRIDGSRLPQTAGFRADQWRDDEGQRHWRGHVDQGVGWRMHSEAWVEFTATLSPGEYEVVVRLGTALLDNNVNEAMQVRVTANATENIEDTLSGQAFHQQLEALVERAFQREPLEGEIEQMLSIVTEVSSAASDRGSWFFDEDSRCDSWAIWPGEELTHSENRDRYEDAEGLMRGWTALIHGLITSYGYLHD